MDKPEPIKPPKEPSGPHLTDRQQAIMKYLEDKVPNLGKIYRGVIFALSQEDNPEHLVQAAHSAREFIRMLPKAFPRIPLHVEKIDLDSKVGELVSAFINKASYEEIERLLKELSERYNHSRIPHRERIKAVFKSIDKGSLPEEEQSRAAKDLLAIYNWFVYTCHHGNEPNEKEFKKYFNGIEGTLYVMSHGYFEVQPELDRLMVIDCPNENHLNILKSLLVKSSLIEYWFTQLENVSWLSLLQKAGFFSSPIGPDELPDGSIRCLSWPQSVFLMKCADKHPKEVTDIILSTERKPTENTRVHQEFVEIAIKLPSTEAARLIPYAKEWIRDKYHMITLLPTRLAELVAKLAKEGERESAFDLASAITDVQMDTEKYKKREKEEEFELSPKAKAYVKDWDYANMFKQFEQALFESNSLDFIMLLCEPLNKALDLENQSKNRKEFVDYSWIWCPSVVGSEQNLGVDELKEILIKKISQFSKKFIGNDRQKMGQMFTLLRSYKFPIFKRIELHILSLEPTMDIDELTQTIGNHALFDEPHTYHEFYVLLEKGFQHIPEESQKAYLDWVKVGPNIDEFKNRSESNTGQDLTEEQLEQRTELWQLNHLAPIREHLTDEWKKLYDELVSKYKEPEHPEFLYHRTSWVGPTSPLSLADLSKKPVEEVITFLKEWQPPGGHFAPTPEGLGRFLSEDVARRPNDYLNYTHLLQLPEIRPVYFYYFFNGLKDSFKAGTEPNWDSLLGLAEALTFAEKLPEPKQSTDDFETGWSGAKKEIARFITESFQYTERVPFVFRDRIWKLITRLIEEPEPTVEYEAKYGGNNMSPIDLSINTGRGVAAHALFRYAYWCDENENKGISKGDQKHHIPEEMLRVVDVLLDPEKEPTETIRSVIGWYIHYLADLDLAWMQKNLSLIIPDDPIHRNLRNAVFEGYFSMNHPRGYMFKNLRAFYEAGFEWASTLDNTSTRHQARQHYFEHLMTFYWWGLESIEGKDSFIERLFGQAKVSVRAHALEYVGRSLETLLPIPPGGPEALERLRDLFDWRIERIKSSNLNPAEIQEELQAFGWWFTYGQMDQRWLIGRLNITLSMTEGVIDWTHGVLERLVSFVSEFPIEVALAVDAIVRGDKTPWNIDSWKDELSSLFEALKSSNNKEAWAKCRQTINYLGERGYRDFGRYLDLP
jgi:hypothetical protein